MADDKKRLGTDLGTPRAITSPFPGSRPLHRGDRNDGRKSRPLGVPIVPSAEFGDKPITNVGLPPEVEMAARIERARSATTSSEVKITARLNQQDAELGVIKTDVAGLKKDQGAIAVDVAEIKGEMKGLRPLVDTLQHTANRLAERDDMHFRATLEVDKARGLAIVEVDKTSGLDQIKARGDRRKLIAKVVATAVGVTAAAVELLHKVIG